MNKIKNHRTKLFLTSIMIAFFLGCNKNGCPYFEFPTEISRYSILSNKIKNSIAIQFEINDSTKLCTLTDTVEIYEYNRDGLLVKKRTKEIERLYDYYQNGLIRLIVYKGDSVKKDYIDYDFDKIDNTIQCYKSRIRNSSWDLTFENSEKCNKEIGTKVYLNQALKVKKIDFKQSIIDYIYDNDLLIKEIWHDIENKPKDIADSTYSIYSYDKGKLKTLAYFNRVNKLQKLTYFNNDCLIDSIAEYNMYSQVIKIVKYKYKRF